MKHRVGTKRIALLAGVSTATVDRVLNDRRGVRPDTARRVLDAARALNKEIDADIDRRRRPQTRVFSVAIQSGAGFSQRIQEAIATLDCSIFF